jgi:hypothetical protein
MAYPPHPYFASKFLFFFGLQAWLRCKIVKTKKFPAKSSSKRSYAQFWPLTAAFGWNAAHRLLRSLCDRVRKLFANTCIAAGAPSKQLPILENLRNGDFSFLICGQ